MTTTAALDRPFAQAGPTWLSAAHYLRAIDADARRLLDVAAADLSAPVPGCPAWDVTDLVRHVAIVFAHKVEVLQTGRRPLAWPPPGLSDREPLGFLREQTTRLLRMFETRDLLTPVWTWLEADQSVGFWLRRMALEIVVHRVDAEQALGLPSDVDEELALDGVAEFLEMIIADVVPCGRDDGSGVSVRFESGDRLWRLTGGAAGLDVVAQDYSPVSVTMAADPATMLLTLWGRLPLAATELRGSVAHYERIQTWLRAAG